MSAKCFQSQKKRKKRKMADSLGFQIGFPQMYLSCPSQRAGVRIEVR